jgi:Protein of unknown function (DUF3179)
MKAMVVAGMLAALALAGCGSGSPAGGSVPGNRVGEAPFSTAGWTTDFDKHSVSLYEFRSGGPGKDGIPAIDHPNFVSTAEADQFLSPREPVAVLEPGGDARAYPLQILVWHEIVNDTVGGRPIAVTYCPLCNSALVFDRRVADRTLTFGTTGNLRGSDLVMWDRQTQSWWQQITGQAVVGDLTGARLGALSAQTLSWAAFRRTYPSGDVLSRRTGFDRDYGTNPYTGYERPNERPFLYDGRLDARLPPKERVASVTVGRDTAVVPFSRLARNPVASFQLGGRPVVVLYARGVASPLDEGTVANGRDVGTAGAFDPRLEGRTLSFERRGSAVVDRQTGSSWDITGRAIAGPLRGRRLTPLRHDEAFWFAIAAFVPHARIVR